MRLEYPEFITQVLDDASKIVKSHFGKVSGTPKAGDPNQVLTEADLAVGNFLIKRIAQVYPKYNVIDEEAGIIDKKSEYSWVIDPIDGTSNFARGVPFIHFSPLGITGRSPSPRTRKPNVSISS